jgi:hypothetical protein
MGVAFSGTSASRCWEGAGGSGILSRELDLAGQRPYTIPAMGTAHGFASTVILRAESPVDAGVFRTSNALLGRTFSPQWIGGMRFLGRCPRLVSRRAVGPEECHHLRRAKRPVGRRHSHGSLSRN